MNDVTLRDYFAGKAVEGILHRTSIPRTLPDTRDIRRSTLKEIAADAYAIADALKMRERADHAQDGLAIFGSGRADGNGRVWKGHVRGEGRHDSWNSERIVCGPRRKMPEATYRVTLKP